MNINACIDQLRNETCFINNNQGDFIGQVGRVELATGGLRAYSGERSFLWRMPVATAGKVIEGFYARQMGLVA